jgi:hypothetical protein
MNSMLSVAIAAVIVVMASACNPSAVAPSPTVARTTVISPSPVSSPSVSLSPEPSPSNQADRMTVGGSAEAGFTQHITLKLPKGWENNDMAAARGSAGPPSGMGFRTTLVDNTFKDPCAHIERTPKIGSTVDALVTALGEIPNATATKAVKTTVAGHDATYLELAFPASLPCSQYFLWQDAPGGDWWLNGPNQLVQIWIVEVGGVRVTLSALSYPTTSKEAKSELQGMLDSIVFDAAP